MKARLIALVLAGSCGAAALVATAPGAAQPAAAGLPSGMIAFFDAPRCPAGWRDVTSSWNGRYVVMASRGSGRTVGTALQPGENRPTGDHKHAAPVSFYGGNCPTNPTGSCAEWARAGIGRGPRDGGGAVALNQNESIVPGTNAPYVELRGCAVR